METAGGFIASFGLWTAVNSATPPRPTPPRSDCGVWPHLCLPGLANPSNCLNSLLQPLLGGQEAGALEGGESGCTHLGGEHPPPPGRFLALGSQHPEGPSAPDPQPTPAASPGRAAGPKDSPTGTLSGDAGTTCQPERRHPSRPIPLAAPPPGSTPSAFPALW